MKQVNWWLSRELIERLKEYQHAERLDSLSEAARALLGQALQTWEAKR